MGCDLGSSPDFVMLAKAYGGQGRMVRGPVIAPDVTGKPGKPSVFPVMGQ